jgi:HK97 family phage portal protein
VPSNTTNHEVIHLSKYSVKSSYYGLPDWHGAIVSIATHTQIGEFNLRYFANSAMPDLAVIIEGGDMAEEDMEELQRYLAENVKGVVNSHKTLIIPINQRDVKIRLEKLSEVKEGGFKLLKDLNRDEIVSAHGVPPRLVSIVSQGNLGGGGEGLAQLATFMEIEVVPGQTFLADALNGYFEQMFGSNPQLKFWEMEIMTFVEKMQSYTMAVQTGILTINEVRKELGYPELDEKNSDFLAQLRAFRDEVVGGAGNSPSLEGRGGSEADGAV